MFFINIGPDLAKEITKSPDNASIIDSMPSPNPNSLFLEPWTVTEIITTTNALVSIVALVLMVFRLKS